MVSSLITGEDLVLAPVGVVHSRAGDDGSSDSDFPDRSALPLNNGQSFTLLWALTFSSMDNRKNIKNEYLIYSTLLELTQGACRADLYNLPALCLQYVRKIFSQRF